MYNCFPPRHANTFEILQKSVPFYAKNIQSSNVIRASSNDEEVKTQKPNIWSPAFM